MSNLQVGKQSNGEAIHPHRCSWGFRATHVLSTRMHLETRPSRCMSHASAAQPGGRALPGLCRRTCWEPASSRLMCGLVREQPAGLACRTATLDRPPGAGKGGRGRQVLAGTATWQHPSSCSWTGMSSVLCRAAGAYRTSSAGGPACAGAGALAVPPPVHGRLDSATSGQAKAEQADGSLLLSLLHHASCRHIPGRTAGRPMPLCSRWPMR